MEIPKLEKTKRRREYDSYSTVIRANVVYSYLSGFTTLFPISKNHTPKHIRFSDKQ
ncbi:hypothetical protein BAZOLSSOX_1384, partial [uncultured Gammaproteobacteria bacterium]